MYLYSCYINLVKISNYNPPSENLPIFNPSVFNNTTSTNTIPNVDSGLFTHPFSPIAAGVLDGPISVSFNTTFTIAPSVTATAYGSNTNACNRLIVTVDGVSTTGFQYYIWNAASSGNAVTPKVSWVAIQQ